MHTQTQARTHSRIYRHTHAHYTETLIYRNTHARTQTHAHRHTHIDTHTYRVETHAHKHTHTKMHTTQNRKKTQIHEEVSSKNKIISLKYVENWQCSFNNARSKDKSCLLRFVRKITRFLVVRCLV